MATLVLLQRGLETCVAYILTCFYNYQDKILFKMKLFWLKVDTKVWVCYWKILITIEKYFDIEKRAIDNQYKPITEKISYWTSININILIDIEKYWKVQYFSIDADP